MTLTALVTGGTSGIGAAIATRLAAEGTRVIISGRSAERGAAVVSYITSAGGEATFIAADLQRAGASARLAAEATAAADGRLDALVNNAGIYRFGPATELSVEDAEAMLRTNVLAVHELTQAIAPGMIERGRGSIVNVSSTMANRSIPGSSMYGATKAAVDLLTGAWATEFGPHGVRVNAVSPGPIHTEGTADFTAFIDELGERLPSGRAGTAEEVAAAVAFLLSPDAAFVQGTTLGVDGGGLAN